MIHPLMIEFAPHMTINVVIQKTGTKTTGRMVQEFTRKVQSTGIVRSLRDKRYRVKPDGKLSRKTVALRRLTKRAENIRLVKEGKLQPKVPRTQQYTKKEN
jgi:ribosomal protein S21